MVNADGILRSIARQARGIEPVTYNVEVAGNGDRRVLKGNRSCRVPTSISGAVGGIGIGSNEAAHMPGVLEPGGCLNRRRKRTRHVGRDVVRKITLHEVYEVGRENRGFSSGSDSRSQKIH